VTDRLKPAGSCGADLTSEPGAVARSHSRERLSLLSFSLYCIQTQPDTESKCGYFLGL